MSNKIKKIITNLGKLTISLPKEEIDKEEEFLKKYPEFNDIHDNRYIKVVMIGNVDTCPFKDYLGNLMKKKDFINIMVKLCPLENNYKFKILKFTTYLNQDEKMGSYLGDKLPITDNVKFVYFPETDEWYSPIDGMTREERMISEHCIEIVNLFAVMPVHHVNHNSDICNAIHVIQRILQSRTCHRLYPDKYPIKNGKVNK